MISKEKILHVLSFMFKSPQNKDVFVIINTVGLKIEQAPYLIKTLIDKGYIEQDRHCRHQWHEPFARYGIVASKRAEIEGLLKKDFANAVLQIEEDDFLIAGDDDKVLACVDCQIFYKESRTFCRKCLGSTIELDKRIADIIFLLNSKGYKMDYSCAGHEGRVGGTYISFPGEMNKIEPPENFAWARNKKVLRMLPYHKVIGIPNKKMQQTTKKEIINRYHLDNIQRLRLWAKALPLA